MGKLHNYVDFRNEEKTEEDVIEVTLRPTSLFMFMMTFLKTESESNKIRGFISGSLVLVVDLV